MGFSTLLDIMGSAIVGGLLFLILLRLNDASVKNTFKNSGELIVQQNLNEVVKIIEYDFRKIGYCKNYNKIPDPSKAITFADSTRIEFLTDIADSDSTSGDGNVDTLKYYLGPASDLSLTPNPDDKLLYRVVNSETPRGSNMGITVFHLTYYNSMGSILSTPVTNLGAIATIEINMEIQSTFGYENEYNTIFWKQLRLVARNLRNR